MQPARGSQRSHEKPTVARFLVALLVALPSVAASARPLQAQALDELGAVRQICEAGPAARLARAERLWGAAQVTAAAVLPNPSLGVEFQRTLGEDSEQQAIVGVSVPVNLSGRRAILKQAATARRAQADAEADGSLFDSALSFRAAYATAVIDTARVKVLAEQQALLDALSATIAGLAKGGEAAEYDLLRQRLHARTHRRALETAKAQAAGSQVLVEAWLGAPASLAPMALAQLAGGDAGDAQPVDGPAPLHPGLRGLAAAAHASELEARAAGRRWVPNLDLFGGYMANTYPSGTKHGFALSLNVPLTFFDHGQGEAALAQAQSEQARASGEQLRRQHDAYLQVSATRLAALKAAAAEFELAVADAATLEDKARQLYAAGEASITELLEAFRAAEEARLDLIDLAQELVLARLARMQAAGSQLDTNLDRACSSAPRRRE
jgi:cobalt-zinc-cadmium efflux system outer membrane protein